MLNDKLKDLIEDKVWETTKETYVGDKVTHCSFAVEYEGLTYDIFYDAWVDCSEKDLDITYIYTDNIQCYVADYKHNKDEGFAREQNDVIEFLEKTEWYE